MKIAGWKIWLASICAGVLVFLFYLPSLDSAFVNWDDPFYVYENKWIERFDFGFLKWAFFEAHIAGNWHPLALISLAIDFQIWGLDPFGYHLANSVLHALNALLLCFLSIRLFAAESRNEKYVLAAAFAAALLWGLHPQRVESVAWISERKDVLCAFFYLLSVIAYTGYLSKGSRPAYIWSLALFALALMSKPMAVSLPFVLILIDLWMKRTGPGKILIEKMPFFAIAALAALLALSAQGSVGAFPDSALLSLPLRILNSVRAYGFYLYKMIIPTGLVPYYPLFPDFPMTGALISLLALLAVTALCALAYFKKMRAPLYAGAFYLVTLLPVIGIIQLGGQAAADRYTYIPSMPLFMLAGFGLTRAALWSKAWAAIMIGIFLAVSAALGALTLRQADIWKDSHALWSHEIRRYPIVFAYKNRAAWLHNAGRYEEAIEDYSIVIKNAINEKELSEFYSKRGQAHRKINGHAAAISDLTRSLSINPANAAALNNRGNSFTAIGRYDLAIEDFRRAIRIEPRNAYLYYNLGYAFILMGDKAEGMKQISTASGLGLKEAREFLMRQELTN